MALVEYPDGTVGQVPALDVRMLDASDAEFDLFDASEDCDVVMTTVGDVRRAYFSGFGDGANDEERRVGASAREVEGRCAAMTAGRRKPPCVGCERHVDYEVDDCGERLWLHYCRLSRVDGVTGRPRELPCRLCRLTPLCGFEEKTEWRRI